MRSRSSVIVVLALAVPRVIRIADSRVWFEDESYLNSALLLHRGFKPFVEVPLLNFPQLDQLLGFVFGLFTPSIRTAEICTQLMVFAVSLLLWRLGIRLGGRVCGVVASLLFATSALVFRYHLFDREFFVVAPVLAATLLVLPASPAHALSARRCATIGALLFAALTVKLTAIGAVLATVLYLAIIARQLRAAAITGTTASVLLLLSTGIHYHLYGDPFLVALFLFRLARAPFASLQERIAHIRSTIDFSVVVGAAGLAWTIVNLRARVWMLPLLHVTVTTIYLVVLNGSFWVHNGLEILPWLALLGGNLVGGFRLPLRPRWRTAIAALSALAVMAWLLPIARNHQTGPLAYSYGFEGWQRQEIATMAAFVRAHSSPQQRLAVPPIIAFEADRDELVPFPEINGVLEELQRSVAQVGYVATLRERRSRHLSFWEEVEASRSTWLPNATEAVRRGETPVVINTPAGSPVHYIGFSIFELVESNYVPSFHTEHLLAWTTVGRHE